VDHPTLGDVKLGAEYSYLEPIYSVDNTKFPDEITRAQSDCSEWKQTLGWYWAGNQHPATQ